MQDAVASLRSNNNMSLKPPTTHPLGCRVWRYEFNGMPFPILSVPEINGPCTGKELQPGEVFCVSCEYEGADGALYLQLLNGEGWVYEKIPGFPALCTRQDDTSDHVFHIGESCSKRTPDPSKSFSSSLSTTAATFSSPSNSSLSTTATTFSSRFHWLSGCCTCRDVNSETIGGEHEQMPLTLELTNKLPSHLSHEDSYDITIASRSFGKKRVTSQQPIKITPRQRIFRDKLELPELSQYPMLPNANSDDHDGTQMSKLLEIYREFAVELSTGLYLTQFTTCREYKEIHCQLVEDMTTMRLDQSNGRIVEFPLTDVARLYKTDFEWFPAENPVKEEHDCANKELLVMVFYKKRVAFVFSDSLVCHRFFICMELLIQRALQKKEPSQDSNDGQLTPHISPMFQFKPFAAETQFRGI